MCDVLDTDDDWDGEPDWVSADDVSGRLLSSLSHGRPVERFIAFEDGVRSVESPQRQIARDGDHYEGLVSYQLFPKYWYGTLSAREYLRLLTESAEAVAASGGLLSRVISDDTDDVMISLSYAVDLNNSGLPSAPLSLAFEKVDLVVARVSRPVEDIADAVNRLIARNEIQLKEGAHVVQRELLHQVETATTPHLRGKALERLLTFAFNRVPGFTVHATNLRTETEEIDIVVLNGINEVPLSREGSLILVECKNWIEKVPRSEMSSLETKIMNRGGRCTVAYFISWNGFTNDADKERLRMSRGNYVVATIAGKELVEALEQGEFVHLLQDSLLSALGR